MSSSDRLALPQNQLRKLALSCGYTRVPSSIYPQLHEAGESFLSLIVRRCKVLLDLSGYRVVKDKMIEISCRWEGLYKIPRAKRIKPRRKTRGIRRMNKTSNGLESLRESQYLQTKSGLLIYHAPICRYIRCISQEIKWSPSSLLLLHCYLEEYLRSVILSHPKEVHYRGGEDLPISSYVKGRILLSNSTKQVSNIVNRVSKRVWSIFYDLIAFRSLISKYIRRKSITGHDLYLFIFFRDGKIVSRREYSSSRKRLKLGGVADEVFPAYTSSFLIELSSLVEDLVEEEISS